MVKETVAGSGYNDRRLVGSHRILATIDLGVAMLEYRQRPTPINASLQISISVDSYDLWTLYGMPAELAAHLGWNGGVLVDVGKETVYACGYSAVETTCPRAFDAWILYRRRYRVDRV